MLELFSLNNIQFDVYEWVILPLLIFLSRIADVSISTIRIIAVMNGKKKQAAILGFLEVVIWLIAIGQIMQNLSNVLCYIGYGAGFATGTFVGMYIEEKIALGILGIRVITQKSAHELIVSLNKKNYGATTVDATGAEGHVNVIFITIKRKQLKEVLTIIKNYNPNAFYTVENIKFVNEGVFPHKKRIQPASRFALKKSK